MSLPNHRRLVDVIVGTLRAGQYPHGCSAHMLQAALRREYSGGRNTALACPHSQRSDSPTPRPGIAVCPPAVGNGLGNGCDFLCRHGDAFRVVHRGHTLYNTGERRRGHRFRTSMAVFPEEHNQTQQHARC
jgi:hypothetical protein